MENYRIFVEKHPRFRVEADSLRRELNTNLNLDIRSLRLLNVYDLFGFSRELLEKSRYSVFGEVAGRKKHWWTLTCASGLMSKIRSFITSTLYLPTVFLVAII